MSKRSDRSENYKEMKTDLINGVYNSIEEFMIEAGKMLHTDGITCRHYILLKETATKVFNR